MFKIILKSEREKLGLSQRQLSEKLNVSQQAVGSWETGRTQPSNEMLERLANYFNITVDQLLGRQHIPLLDNEDDKINTNTPLDQELEEILKKLEADGSALMFKGEPINDATKEALLISLKNTLELAEKMNNLDKDDK